MKNLFRPAAVVLLTVISAVILCLSAGCGKEKRSVLNLVTEPPYPPFEYYANDKLTGIDIDIMQEIAERLHYDLKIHPVSFETVMQSVASGQADVGISCITITKERAKLFHFSQPYISISQVILVTADSPIRQLKHLNGKLIGAQADTTGEAYVKEKYGKAVPYPNIEVAADALSNGKIDALVLDNLTAEDLVRTGLNFRMLPEKLTQESYGIAVSKKRPELLKKINRCLDDMLKTNWIAQSVKRHTERPGTQKEPISKIPQLKIGIVPFYPPYESKENGVIKGIDVDIIRRICDENGFTPLFVEISSDTVYQSILENDVAISISSLTITEKRKKKVNFSIPYSEVSQRILVKNQSAFRNKEDLRGKTIGVVIGTTSEEQGLRISTELERYSEPKLILDALERGEVDAVVLDDIILKQLTMHSKKFRLLPDILIKEEYGIAVSPKNPELLEKINRVLLKMKQDGTLEQIHAKHISEKRK